MRYRFTDYQEMCDFYRRYSDAVCFAYYELNHGKIVRKVWYITLQV